MSCLSLRLHCALVEGKFMPDAGVFMMSFSFLALRKFGQCTGIVMSYLSRASYVMGEGRRWGTGCTLAGMLRRSVKSLWHHELSALVMLRMFWVLDKIAIFLASFLHAVEAKSETDIRLFITRCYVWGCLVYGATFTWSLVVIVLLYQDFRLTASCIAKCQINNAFQTHRNSSL